MKVSPKPSMMRKLETNGGTNITDIKPEKGPTKRQILLATLFAVIGFIFLAIYVLGALAIGNSQFADSLTLCPTMYTDVYEINLTGAKKQALSIPTANKETLDAWYFKVPGASKLVIVNHGNAGNLTSRGFVAQVLRNEGLNVLLYDYRGYGKSTGQASRQAVLEDGWAAYTYAHDKLHYKPEQIIEFGESIGSTAACFVASQQPIGALMLQSPLDSLPTAGKWVYPVLNIFPDFLFAAPHMDNTKLMNQIHSPVFIIHGKVDTTLRPGGSQILFDHVTGPKTLVYLPDCGHNDMGIQDAELYVQSIDKFVHSLK